MTGIAGPQLRESIPRQVRPPIAGPSTALEPWLVHELDSVPTFETFATADELAAATSALADAYPELVTLRRVGTSALGEPLTCLTVDVEAGVPTRSRRPDALVFGLPHPNEPIGGLTAVHLARRLAEDAGLRERLGLRWHIVACIDPDGLRLNEGWLKGPFTREHYARHFYRQAGPEQVEWTFPLDHKQAYFDAVLPETLALMRLIDEHRPALMASLHNSEFGGVYYYLSRAAPPLHPTLQQIPAHFGLGLDRGEPEAPWIPRLADGIFRSIDVRDAYDHLEAMGSVRAFSGGNSTGAYADRHGTFTLVCELPYWTDPCAADARPTKTKYVEALGAMAAGLRELAVILTDTLTSIATATTVDSPFLRASRFYAPVIANDAADGARRAAALDPERPATVAELASLADAVHMFRLRYGGMMLRALDAELAVGNTRPAIRAAHRDLGRRYADWCTQATAVTPTSPVPIRALVATQYGSVIAGAAHVTGVH